MDSGGLMLVFIGNQLKQGFCQYFGFLKRTVLNLTPCGSFGPKRGRCQIAGQVRGWNLIKIGNFPRLLTDMTNTPYASMAFVSVWMGGGDRKSTRLNSSHVKISYAVFCLKKKMESV